jgi:hypothetical protein
VLLLAHQTPESKAWPARVTWSSVLAVWAASPCMGLCIRPAPRALREPLIQGHTPLGIGDRLGHLSWVWDLTHHTASIPPCLWGQGHVFCPSKPSSCQTSHAASPLCPVGLPLAVKAPHWGTMGVCKPWESEAGMPTCMSVGTGSEAVIHVREPVSLSPS